MSSSMYSEIQLSTDIESANGHELIKMLYQKCLQQIVIGRVAILEKNNAKKYKALNNAIDIVDYLKICLNDQEPSASQLVARLQDLHNFLEKSMLQAVLESDVIYLDHAERVLLNIKEGWDGIGQ